jgi:hypothetical protein
MPEHNVFDAIQLASLVLALLGGLVPLFERQIRRRLGLEKEESYSEKVLRLTSSLEKASREVDSVLKELASVAKTRANAVSDLESPLSQLSQHEQALRKQIEDLRATPVPVAEHFAELIAKGERRSAFRDYALFGLGVVVSTLIAIVLRLLGLG